MFLTLYSKNDVLHLSFDLFYLDKKMLAKHEEAKKMTFLNKDNGLSNVERGLRQSVGVEICF